VIFSTLVEIPFLPLPIEIDFELNHLYVLVCGVTLC
jgi:hypothetical protein